MVAARNQSERIDVSQIEKIKNETALLFVIERVRFRRMKALS